MGVNDPGALMTLAKFLFHITLLAFPLCFIAKVQAQEVDSDKSKLKEEPKESPKSPSSDSDVPMIDGKPVKPIAPLDAWHFHPPKSEENKTDKDDLTDEIVGSVPERTLEMEEDEETFYFDDEEKERFSNIRAETVKIVPKPPKPKKVLLKPLQKKRLARAERIRRKLVRQQRALLRAKQEKDVRGEAEVTICSINLQSFGLPVEVRRIAPARMATQRARIKSISESINTTGCSIVAAQGLIGKDVITINKVVKIIVSKLEKSTNKKWKGYAAPTNHQLSTNAFFVSDDILSVNTYVSHADIVLPRFGQFKEKSFPRGPFEINVTVSGKDGAKNKRIILVTMYLNKSIKRVNREPISTRIQFAEGMRQLVQLIQGGIDITDPPIIILLGDRSFGKYDIGSKILGGKIRLKDFKAEGGCDIEEDPKEKAVCKALERRPRSLIGILSEAVDPLPQIVSKKIDDKRVKVFKKIDPEESRERRNKEFARTVEIYMLPEDLPIAWKRHNAPGQYDSGTVSIDKGIKTSPLAWVRLNW